MRDYIAQGMGLVIPTSVWPYVSTHHEKWDEKTWGDDYQGFLYYLEDISGKRLVSFCECNGDFYTIDETDFAPFNERDAVDDESFFLLEIDRYPSLFQRAYIDINEIVDEFKKSVGKYFPEDFDFQRYLVSFHGTYWG